MKNLYLDFMSSGFSVTICSFPIGYGRAAAAVAAVAVAFVGGGSGGVHLGLGWASFTASAFLIMVVVLPVRVLLTALPTAGRPRNVKKRVAAALPAANAANNMWVSLLPVSIPSSIFSCGRLK